MRMRKKKNLESRINNCEGYLLELENENKNFQDAANEKKIIDFEEVFQNKNDIVLEIGCGKGTFACTFAKENPNINIVAVEKVSNVIVSACEMAEEMELKNIIFLKGGAEYLESYIKSHSISTIFLNFSCPYPKKSYRKHRLTHENFLRIYENLLKDGAPIFQKTDNMHFFEFSLESFSNYGFTLSNISLDLHNSDFEGNIVTEYEKRFTDLGQPIYRLEARLKK